MASDLFDAYIVYAEKVNNLMLAVKIGGDDDNLAYAEIASASHNGNMLKIKNGMIEIGNIDKGAKKVLRVKLFEEGRKSLEVRAYAKR